MNITVFLASDIFVWVVLPLLIFFARILDVSIGTIRIIFVNRGYKYIAPLLGFFEIIIWLFAARQIMVNMPNFVCFFAYAFGFSAGTFVGIIIEERMSIGKVIVWIITKKDASELVEYFNNSQFHMTSSRACNVEGDVNILYLIAQRNEIGKIIHSVKEYDPGAFYSVEDVRYAKEDINIISHKKRLLHFLRSLRKGK
ncbi:hypothetical protein COV93_00260 [Candidatus Woesearchaeota archaeon CG11_big_fil_rev_8_21_14_0_20_43_8]|nr:MAG: hypothetical protein COV93_00260 [Candidatus Woesearchaeota archaeon CG11_big_fil_rev_8_21_14_0_20_43_8]PIO07035.1 MAG: hypothetical protein COT47_01825 [Candidatus Woesearchaeota archaeon CG08_land_8_20_14_0_20_43_7]